MNEQNLRFRLGLFFLVMLLLLGGLILIFGGFPTLFESTNEYTIVFTNAQGIAPGTPVRRSGVKIGEVRDLTLDNVTGKVRVRIRVRDDFKVRKADRPSVITGLLGSDSAIEFVPPPPNGKLPPVEFAEPGDTLEGVAMADPATLMQKTSELMPPVQEALIEIKKVLQRFDKDLAPIVEDTMKEFREVAKMTQEFIPEMRKTNIELHEIAKQSRATIPDLRKTNEEFQLTARNWSKVGERMDVFLQTNEEKLVKTIDQLNDTLKKVSVTFSDQNQKYVTDLLKNSEVASRRFDGIAFNVDELLKETRGMVKDLNKSVKNVEDAFADLRKATKPLGDRGEIVMKNLQDGTEQLNKLLSDARQIVLSVGRGDGTIQRLLVDPSLYNHLNESASSLNRVMPRIERIIRDVEIFADKIARHPEALGVGGAIRPGSGLKEPPSSVMPWRVPGH